VFLIRIAAFLLFFLDGADQGTMDRDGDGLDESLFVSELEGNQEAEDGLVEESVLQPEEEDLEDDVEGETAPPRCESTGVYYPSSSAMELLASYDDGLSSNGGEDPMHIGAFPVVGSNEDKEVCTFLRTDLFFAIVPMSTDTLAHITFGIIFKSSLYFAEYAEKACMMSITIWTRPPDLTHSSK
jgi:hypothetical protein